MAVEPTINGQKGLMEFYILYYMCSEEHECHMEQRIIDHIDGIFKTREAVQAFLDSGFAEEVPLYEDEECKGVKDFPCYFLHRYDTILPDGQITTNWS